MSAPLNAPDGASAISSHGYDSSFNLPWSRELPENRQLTKMWDAFVEYAGDFPEAGGPTRFAFQRGGDNAWL